MSVIETEVQFPKKLLPLRKPARYKVLYGGRGGAKSWSVARALLTAAAERKLRVLCCRELQTSLKESVHRLLSDQVELLGLGRFYTIHRDAITGINDSEFQFEGLRFNQTKIKSYEGVDIAWVEQAERVTKSSWEILIPTVRRPGSEIWLTMNPELEEDESYQRFVLHPPDDAVVIKVDWRDNPWFPDVLHREMLELQRRDPDAWLNIWEGHCRAAIEGAIYAHELREALSAGRICRVPYDRSLPVHTAWDLGHSDHTAIWFFQQAGFEYHFIRFVQDNQRHLPHYLKLLQDLPYIYGTDYLPHDAASATLGSKAISEMMKDAGRRVVVVPKTDSVTLDINVVRTGFDSYWFDQEGCADGLQALRHYRYAVDEETGKRSRLPLHDEWSDGADALRTFAVGYRGQRARRSDTVTRPPPQRVQEGASLDWMGA